MPRSAAAKPDPAGDAPSAPPSELDVALAAAKRGERYVIKRGRRRFAVIGPADLALLEAAEAAEDADLLATSRRADAENEALGEPNVSWSEVKREAGLS